MSTVGVNTFKSSRLNPSPLATHTQKPILCAQLYQTETVIEITSTICANVRLTLLSRSTVTLEDGWGGG